VLARIQAPSHDGPIRTNLVTVVAAGFGCRDPSLSYGHVGRTARPSNPCTHPALCAPPPEGRHSGGNGDHSGHYPRRWPIRHNSRVTTRTGRAKPDTTLSAAVDVAVTALAELMDEDAFGAHLGCVAEDERVVTHLFAATSPGYRGWQWAVTLVRAPRQKTPTVSEIVMLPGDDALLAPEWVPWSSRLQAGDLGPGDLLPVAGDDVRLVPGYLVGEDQLDRPTREVISEVGLGRPLVLSADGRELAATRWYEGEQGPSAPIAQAAPGPCGTCGFLVRIAGPLGAMFGVCANEKSPSDGSIVSYDHGCGGHSSVRADDEAAVSILSEPYFDTMTWDDIEIY
jgi:hypothetical protein